LYSRRAIQHAPPNRLSPLIDPLAVPTVDEQEVALLDGLPPPPPDDAVVLAVCDVETDVPCVAIPGVAPCVAAPLDDVDPPVTGEPPIGADGGGAEPLTWAGETMVCVGTASGSVPQDDDVVTPPVAFSDVAQGMSGRPVIGALRSSDDAASGVDAPISPGTAVPGVPGVSVCAHTGANTENHRIVASMNRRSIALSLFVSAV
jgi:hypothetical protein